MRILSLLLLVLTAAPLAAQQPADSATGTSSGTRRVATAAPLTGQVRVDGRLDDAAWAAAPVLAEFTQAYPDPGSPASERTEVRVLVGPDALYVGARMFDSSPDSIAAQLSRRDVTGYSDRVSVFVDARDDRRTSFGFGVTPRGVKIDSYQFDDNREDNSWDAVWDVGTTIDSLGWTAEFRIPFSQLRFPPRVQGERVWGLGIMRDLARRDERSTWSPWNRNVPGFVSSFGELRGLAAVRAPTRLEILPYTSARLERSPGDAADPFYHENDMGAQVGADFQYGLPGGLTLTGTLNPDFGQVEVDPAFVNLSAFEVFLAERRPFFVEGSDIFRFGNVSARNYLGFPEYFYSRRIGRAPQRRVSGSDIAYVDVPDQSTILGAVKVSGRTAGGWSVGVLNAVTAEEEARFRTTLGESGAQGVEPLTNYFVGRLRRDVNRGNTVVGAIVTATNREMSDSLYRPVLRGDAYMAGIDAQHSWKNREWTLSGFLAGSRISGSEAVIRGAQLSSARFYQRPDADHVELDPTRTSLGGRIGALALSHTGRWDGSLVYQESSPGFEVNDLGYLNITDRRAFSTYLGRRVNRPTPLLRSHTMAVYSNHAWTFGGDNVMTEFAGSVSGTFTNFWNLGMTVGYAPDYMDDRLTRGGPLALAVANWRVTGTLGSDRRKPVHATTTGTWHDYTSGEFIRALSGTVTLRPSTSLLVSVGPRYERVRTEGQFITVRADSLARGTFGRRYVFSDLDQTTVSFDTRVNWTFTPNLSLEVFAQPYVVAGDFSSYKEFLTPRGYDFLIYGQDGTSTLAPVEGGGFRVDPDGPAGPATSFVVGANGGQRDFTFRSLRGNAVLRWEYRPGSTLFFVWQQLRSGESLLGDLNVGRDLSDVFQEPASNVFLIKATYWVGR